MAEAVKEKPKKLGLCLAGGGARGFAHIGAVRAFEEAGIEFDIVAGTSVGSLIGALYCFGVTSDQMFEYGRKLKTSDIVGLVPTAMGDPMRIGKILFDLVGDKTIEESPKKFAAVATDIVDAQEVVLDSGDLITSVVASCSVPLLFKPTVIGDKHLVDGGLLNNVPARVCRDMGATHVVSVDINPKRGCGTDKLGFFDIMKATMLIMLAGTSGEAERHSDVLITPDMTKYLPSSKYGWRKMVETGYESTKAKIDEIKALIAD